MVGYAVRRYGSYLTNGNGWSEQASDLLLISSLSKAKKVCKKHKFAVVAEVVGIQAGEVVYRQK